MNKNTLRCFSIVGYSFVLMFLMQTMIGSLHSLFLVPVTEGLGMDRGAFSLMFTIAGFAGVASLPVITKLLQKYPARIVVSVSILLAGGGFAVFSQATELWQFFAIAIVMGAGNSGCTLMVASLLINNWFEDRKGQQGRAVIYGRHLRAGACAFAAGKTAASGCAVCYRLRLRDFVLQCGDSIVNRRIFRAERVC